jgi:hypothetical protein
LYAGDSYLTAAHCYFVSGNNNTATFGVIGDTFKLSIYDNKAGKFILEYQYEISTEIPENGGFGIWTYKNLEVGCKKPYVYTEPAEETEVTISGYTFGANNRADYFDLVIGNGEMQKAIVNYGQDLTHLADCTFGTESTWGSDTVNPFKFHVGVLASGTKSFQIFPTGHAAKVGDKLTIPQGATITVGEYTAIFGEAFEAWFNGETWQMEYVASLPAIIGSETVTVDRGEEIVLDDLKAALTLVNPNEEYIFEVLQATLVGSEEVIDLSGLETYAFTKMGTYEVKYQVSNNSAKRVNNQIVNIKNSIRCRIYKEQSCDLGDFAKQREYKSRKHCLAKFEAKQKSQKNAKRNR